MGESEHPVELALPFAVFVDGDPAPKGSVARNRTKGVRHTKRSASWHDVQVDAIRLASRNLRMANLLCGHDLPLPYAPLTRDVAVRADFVLRQPRSNRDTAPHAKRHGDLDKHLRSLLDALVAAKVLADDSLVIEVSATKRWAAPTERCGVSIGVHRPTSEVLREAFTETLDQLYAEAIVPMSEPRGPQNLPGTVMIAANEAYDEVACNPHGKVTPAVLRRVADLTRIVPPGDINELSGNGGA